MKKLVVWDLFGGGQNSVYNGLKENDLLKYFDVYTFDVTEPTREKHYKLDLSQDNIVEIFKKYPKPDIIVSSTLCQSFSCVLNMKGGGTCFWKYKDDSKTELEERSVEEFERLKGGFTRNLKSDVQLFIKRLGERCINNTIELIKHYQPKLWYIENPKHSLIWKYIKFNRTDFYDANKMFLNETSLGKYGFFTTKPTIFLSNVKLELLKGKIEPPYEVKEIDGVKYYVLKDDPSVKVEYSLDSRMIGLASIKKMIKARSVKSGMGGMDFVMRSQKQYTQKNKMVNEQLSEAGPASSIPHPLIFEIFKQFLNNIDDSGDFLELQYIHQEFTTSSDSE
ncbi:C5 methylase (MAV1virus-like) protein [Mycoplasma sp. NEAQ87857]|uniref:C5 methylase (MAV1virus-like) protein n=1 Tax=Mycoplasma sp. NEAQ87857 TaxID=2683967 RepID=UPI0018EEF609|nr:C5 methylase (MAV1virus-like) protein [Mycoplasma sp. NEAQ87857]